MSNWEKQLDLLIRARTPNIWIRSNEEERVETLLKNSTKRLSPRRLARWDYIDETTAQPRLQKDEIMNSSKDTWIFQTPFSLDNVKEKLGAFADAVMEIPGKIADFFKGIFAKIKNFFIGSQL